MSAPCPMLGFIVTIAPHDDASVDERAALTRDLVNALEAHGLTTTRGSGRVVEIVVHREGSQATDTDRAIAHAWAARWAERATIAVGDLIDLT